MSPSSTPSNGLTLLQRVANAAPLALFVCATTVAGWMFLGRAETKKSHTETAPKLATAEVSKPVNRQQTTVPETAKPTPIAITARRRPAGTQYLTAKGVPLSPNTPCLQSMDDLYADLKKRPDPVRLPGMLSLAGETGNPFSKLAIRDLQLIVNPNATPNADPDLQQLSQEVDVYLRREKRGERGLCCRTHY